jgi:ABC-2 type transport system permease protein
MSLNKVINREWKRMKVRPIYFLASVGTMFFCYVFFLTFFAEGLPQQLPIGVIDKDNTSTSRTLIQTIDNSPQINIIRTYPNFSEARNDMQKGDIYAIVELSSDFEADLLANRQPKITFYVNDAYLVAGSLSYKELTFINELAAGFIQQQMLQAKGIVGEENLMPILQPVAIDTHLIANYGANYGVYLLNVLVFGVLQLCVLMLTIFCIGVEIKEQTVGSWLAIADESVFTAVVGKLLPYTVLFSVIGIIGNILLFRFMHFPMNGSLIRMSGATVLYVMAYQAIGFFMISLFPRIRDTVSFAAFYGLLAFTYAGFTFPIEGMPRSARIFSELFPIRHYFKIYVNEALNGTSFRYSVHYIAAMAAFLILPVLVSKRFQNVIFRTDKSFK